MLNSQGCIFLFVLYISGIHTISKPLDTVNINLNIDESKPPAYPAPSPPAYPTTSPTPYPNTYPASYPTAAYDGAAVGEASSGGEQAAGSSCEDIDPEGCPRWRRFCTSGRWKNWMEKNCQITCKTCPETSRRVRKNVAKLKLHEKQRLQTALREAIASEDELKNYKHNGNIHGAPRTICQNNKPYGNCCPHGSSKFLTWHRLFMVNMEQLLDQPLPYWEWTKSGDVPDLWEEISAPIMPPKISGGENCISDNGKNKHRRGKNIHIDVKEMKEKTRVALEAENYDTFNRLIELPHGMIHLDMKCDMAKLATAGYDPVFYLHHAYIDYLFAYWQELQRLRKEQGEVDEEVDLNKLRASGTLDPFNRIEVNPYEITQRNSKPTDVLDYKNNLDYEYDKLIFDEMTPRQFLENIKSNSKKENKKESQRIFVGIIEPKAAPTSELKYAVCNSQNHCVKGGRVSTFGDDLSFAIDKTRTDSDDFIVEEDEVTSIFNEETGFDEKAYARIIYADERDAMTGLQPIMIWKKNGILEGGTVYLAKGVSKNTYGTLLDEYDRVVENIAR